MNSAPPKQLPRGLEWLLIVIVLLYAGGLLLLPLISIVWGALSQGLLVCWQQLNTPDARQALLLTLIISIGATAINTILGLIISWLLVRDRCPGKQFINAMIDLPFAISPIISGFMIILLFGRNGWLALISEQLGINIVFAFPGLLLATIFVSLPFVIREVMPVWQQLGNTQEQAAITMGASNWQTFWHITLPAISDGLLSGISLTFARALGEFGAVLVVGGGIKMLTETATLYIYRSMEDRNYVGAYAMALLLMLCSFGMLLALEFFQHRRRNKQRLIVDEISAER